MANGALRIPRNSLVYKRSKYFKLQSGVKCVESGSFVVEVV
jgi:hypothetical protein